MHGIMPRMGVEGNKDGAKIDRRQFLKMSAATMVSATAVAGLSAKHVEASAMNPVLALAISYVDGLKQLFSLLNKNVSDDPRRSQEFENYFKQETEKYLNKYAKLNAWQRTPAVDAEAIATAAFQAISDPRIDRRLSNRLQVEYYRISTALAKGSQ